MKVLRLSIVLSLTLCCSEAFGYVGPGTGITLVGSLIGLVTAVAVSLWALLSWPVRQLIRRFRHRGDEQPGEMAEGERAENPGRQ